MSTEQENGERIALNAAALRLFKGEYRDSGDRHSDALFVREGLAVALEQVDRLRATVAHLEQENAAMRGALEWNDGLPPVPEGKEGRFLVSSSGVIHLLLYCNKFWAPCSDDCEPPENAPSNDDGDVCWSGWCEESCEQCDTFWTFSGKVDGWKPLPAALRTAPARTDAAKPRSDT
jgi:hypothetical protein